MKESNLAPALKDDNAVWVTKPDMSSPETGMFRVKLGKGHLARALAVVFREGHWEVFLDGVMIAPQDTDWKKAFGRLHRDNEIIGTRISVVDYTRLVRQRIQDRESGHDLDSAFDSRTVRIP